MEKIFREKMRRRIFHLHPDKYRLVDRNNRLGTEHQLCRRRKYQREESDSKYRWDRDRQSRMVRDGMVRPPNNHRYFWKILDIDRLDILHKA